MSRVWLKSGMKEMNIIIRNARVYKLFCYTVCSTKPVKLPRIVRSHAYVMWSDVDHSMYLGICVTNTVDI